MLYKNEEFLVSVSTFLTIVKNFVCLHAAAMIFRCIGAKK